MGIIDFMKKQLVAIIQWNESSDGVLAYRFPMKDMEIQNGGQLTVRESQLAMFINEGVVGDVFQPGMYTLTTRTLPVLTALRNWDKGFDSPFKSDVYFFSTREQLDQKWGTSNAITVRDKEYGPLRIRANGNFSYRVSLVEHFFKKVSGTREVYTTEDLDGQLRTMVMSNIAATLGKGEIPFLDMAGNQLEFGKHLKTALEPAFAEYGLELTSFNVQSISLPDEVQAYLDKASQMRFVGDMNKFAQFEAADSIKTAAANPGGMAGAGVGLGAGLAMGQSMASAFQQAPAAAAAPPEDPLAVLERLHGLVGKGILTQAEYDAKKAEILSKLK